MPLFLLFGTILTLTGIGTLFNLHIPRNITEKIKFIRLDHDPLNNDKLYWMGNPNGLFTIKSVLHIPKQPPPNPFHHSWIWKQNIPNKIKFCFGCAHIIDFLPTPTCTTLALSQNPFAHSINKRMKPYLTHPTSLHIPIHSTH